MHLRAIRKNEGYEAAGGSGSSSALEPLAIPVRQNGKLFEARREERDASLRLRAQVIFQLTALVAMVEVLHRLLQADGDEQANTDGADMDEEVFPRMGGVGHVDVEHGGVLLGSCGDGRGIGRIGGGQLFGDGLGVWHGLGPGLAEYTVALQQELFVGLAGGEFGGAGFADAAATPEELDHLQQAVGDDEANAESDDTGKREKRRIWHRFSVGTRGEAKGISDMRTRTGMGRRTVGVG